MGPSVLVLEDTGAAIFEADESDNIHYTKVAGCRLCTAAICGKAEVLILATYGMYRYNVHCINDDSDTPGILLRQ
jgi:hypothetical protein